MVRIVIADERHFIADGIKSRLRKQESVIVVGIASSVRTLRSLLSKNHVDVLLISDQPREHKEQINRFRTQFPRLKILITAFAFIREAIELALQADGIVFKDWSAKKLREAIQTVYTEGEFFPPEAQHVMFEMARKEKALKNSGVKLTPRELQVLQCIASRMGNKQIAAHLAISENTVKKHRKELHEKLDVHDVVSLLDVARSLGLIK